VLLERRVAIGPDETAGELLERLAPIGAAALLEAIGAIAAGTAQPRAQDHAAATHAPMLTKADGAIDFARPAREVAARIRGVDPWPGAFALLKGQPLKLFHAAEVATATGELGAPGEILAITPVGITVACRGSAIAIREVQAAGRKRMTAAQFAAGRGLAVGDVLS
jgi:methionyl-tRNA formyltransferase